MSGFSRFKGLWECQLVDTKNEEKVAGEHMPAHAKHETSPPLRWRQMCPEQHYVMQYFPPMGTMEV